MTGEDITLVVTDSPVLTPLFLGLKLQALQSEGHDASCLPALKVSDIERSIPSTELVVALAGR